MTRNTIRRAALAAAALIVSSLVPGLGAPARAAGDTVTLTGTLQTSTGVSLDVTDIHFFPAAGGFGIERKWNDVDEGFSVELPAGAYKLHLWAKVPTYWAGLADDDKEAPGLFLDFNLNVSTDRHVDLTVPIDEVAVHVVDRVGQPAPGMILEGWSLRFDMMLGPDVQASRATLENDVAVRTDQNGDGTLWKFAGAPLVPVYAKSLYDALGRVDVPVGDRAATLVLNAPVLEARLHDARGPLPAPSVDHAWVSFSSATPDEDRDAVWYRRSGNTVWLQGSTGDHFMTISNRDTSGQSPAGSRPATATLPGTWSIGATYTQRADATVDFTIPDAAPADIILLDRDGQPVTGLAMTYKAAALKAFPLTPSLWSKRAEAFDTIAAVDGRYRPMMFGPSTLTVTVAGTTFEPITVSPGETHTLQLEEGVPGAPQNVTATAGNGQVTVTWDAPGWDGGSPVTGYTVTASQGGTNHKTNAGGSATTATVGSLTNGKQYTVTVVAKNTKGASAASAPVTVTLSADPSVPTTTTTTAPAQKPGDGRPGGGGDGGPTGGVGAGTDGGPGTTSPTGSGYWLLGTDGTVYPFGDAAAHGDIAAALGGSSTPAARVRAVDLEPTPSGRGYWILDSRGRVHPFGGGGHFGDVVPSRLAAGESPASLSATPSGAGYWVFTDRGRVIAFGDAAHLGDMTGTVLNGPVLDSVATPSGRGYYMVASDGGIFAFGDAAFAGSMGGKRLNAPVRSLVPDGDGTGYWLVASDGGIFAFDAPFRGSMGGRPLNKPMRGMVRYGDGYLMVAEDGGIFAFSDRPFTGSLGSHPPASPIVSVGALG